jgi:HSP20 family molecular chaperone IbpA
LSTFLNNLGERLGVDLSAAVEGLGLEVDRFKSGRTGTDVDFEPRTDIFEGPNKYTIHLSLPGAKKSDVGVDWDGEQSVLRIAGVVHRLSTVQALMKK